MQLRSVCFYQISWREVSRHKKGKSPNRRESKMTITAKQLINESKGNTKEANQLRSFYLAAVQKVVSGGASDDEKQAAQIAAEKLGHDYKADLHFLRTLQSVKEKYGTNNPTALKQIYSEQYAEQIKNFEAVDELKRKAVVMERKARIFVNDVNQIGSRRTWIHNAALGAQNHLIQMVDKEKAGESN